MASKKKQAPEIQEIPRAQSKLGLYKVAFQAALISNGILVLFILSIHFFTNSNALDNGRVIIESIIPISAMFMACWWYRENHKTEPFHFWQGVLINGLIAFMVAIMNALFIYLFCAFIAPDALKEHIIEIQKITERVKQVTININGIEGHNALKAANARTTPWVMATNEFQLKFIIGNIFMVIASLVMRRKSPAKATK